MEKKVENQKGSKMGTLCCRSQEKESGDVLEEHCRHYYYSASTSRWGAARECFFGQAFLKCILIISAKLSL